MIVKGNNKKSSKVELIEEKSRVLNLLSKLPSGIRSKVISVLSPIDIKLICEIFVNLLLGNLTKSKLILKKLVKHRKEIVNLANKKFPLYKKKQILNSKSGGFLLGALLPIAATLLSKLIR